MKTLIVGGVAGGASAAARLRRLREEDEIILFEKGDYISFANCGLPYHVGGVIDKRKALLLQTPKAFKEKYAVDVRIGERVLGVNAEKKSVSVMGADGAVYEETYDRLILSPGAKPFVPDFVEASVGERLFTLNDIPDMDALKSYCENHPVKSAAVIGGGFIGVETAENLSAVGMEVQIIELMPQLLGVVDWDFAYMAQKELAHHQVKVCTGEQVQKISGEEDGVCIVTDRGVYRKDIVVCAVGVRPATDFLKDSGIEMDSRGAVVVNERMETTVHGVYAVGDAVCCRHFVNGEESYIPLAGPANKQGRIAADQIAGVNHRYHGTQGSSVIKIFDKTLAFTGLTERRAGKFKKVYACGKSHAGYYPGAKDIWMKLIFNPEDGKVLGAQAFGEEGVDKRIDVLAAAIRAGMTVDDIAELELCYAPPYGTAKDVINMAGFEAQNELEGLISFVHGEPHKIAELSESKILDVRTKKEYDAGHIEGCIHIPLQELRNRLDELTGEQNLLVYCKGGMRSYMACRILLQNGYRCQNLSGGYDLYCMLYN